MKIISETLIDIRWVDIDSYGHLNNAKYYDFMSESRAQAFLSFADLCNFVVVENSCKFKKQVIYPCSLLVKQKLKAKGNASFELVYEFLDKENNTLYAEGFAKMVCCDKSKNTAIKIPQEVLPLVSE